MSKVFNPTMSMRNEEDRLREAVSEYQRKRVMSNVMKRKFRTEEHRWQTMVGESAVGEPFIATLKEIKAMNVEAEKKFTSALKKWKPASGKERPRLTTYDLVKPARELKPEKKLWEQA